MHHPRVTQRYSTETGHSAHRAHADRQPPIYINPSTGQIHFKCPHIPINLTHILPLSHVPVGIYRGQLIDQLAQL